MEKPFALLALPVTTCQLILALKTFVLALQELVQPVLIARLTAKLSALLVNLDSIFNRMHALKTFVLAKMVPEQLIPLALPMLPQFVHHATLVTL
jgi:hypothetical protein